MQALGVCNQSKPVDWAFLVLASITGKLLVYIDLAASVLSFLV